MLQSGKSTLAILSCGILLSTAGCLSHGMEKSTMQGDETGNTHHVLELDPLTLSFHPPKEEETWRLVIEDSRTGRTWEGVSGIDSYRDPHFVEAHKTDDRTLHVVLRHPNRPITFDCVISLEEGAVARFDVTSREPDAELDAFHFPPRMTTSFSDGALLFADRSPGILLPQTNHHYNTRLLYTYGNVSALDLPWIGVLDRTDGDGLMIHFDTPENCGAYHSLCADGFLWPRVAWMPSMGTFEYPRQASFHFIDGGGHVAIAKHYREIADGKGKIVPLTERARERERIEWLLGAPYIWGRSDEEFARQLHAHGIRRAVIKGRSSADQMMVMKDLGFLTSEYDSYTDIQEGEPGPQSDRIAETALINRAGNPVKGWQTHHGIQYYVRSHYFARDRAQLYVPPILERHPFTARFIDVSAAIQPFEDWAPGRRFGARQDLDYRRDLFRYFIDDLQLVLGAEHAKGWTMPLIDYSEGNMSGSFWWESERPGQLLPFLSLDEMSDDYWNIGMNMEWRVPLWDLVYHDVVVSTWYWGDSNGYYYNILPEKSDLKDALNILHGTPAMMWANHLCYGWDRNRERFIETYRVTGRWHEQVGFDELVNHEWLTDDRLVQRTTFSSGATAIANLGEKPQRIVVNGEEVTLPRHGFHATAGNFTQWRHEVNGGVETVVMGEDFLSLETENRRDLGPFSGTGLIDFYHVDDTKWHILSQGRWTLNPWAVGAFPENIPLALVGIDEEGNPIEDFGRFQPGSTIAIPHTDSMDRFALLLGVEEHDPLLMPAGGSLRPGQAVRISSGPGTSVRYELSGGEVTAQSPLYTEPLVLESAGKIRARAFIGEEPASDTVEGSFHVTRVLFESDVARTHEDPIHISLDISGARSLRLRIGDAGDGLDFDSAALGDAHVVARDGQKIHLKDLEVIRYSESDSRDHSIDADDISIGGMDFGTAIRTHAFADFIFALDGSQERFEAFFGIPDDTEGMGSITLRVEGVY